MQPLSVSNRISVLQVMCEFTGFWQHICGFCLDCCATKQTFMRGATEKTHKLLLFSQSKYSPNCLCLIYSSVWERFWCLNIFVYPYLLTLKLFHSYLLLKSLNKKVISVNWQYQTSCIASPALHSMAGINKSFNLNDRVGGLLFLKNPCGCSNND